MKTAAVIGMKTHQNGNTDITLKIQTMKKFLLPMITLVSTIVYAQVGINNPDPKATMDITTKTTDGSRPEGLIVPRLTGDQVRSANAQYSTAQIGTLVYATSADSAPAGKTANITSAGYYYFDGSTWQKILSGAGSYDATNDSWVNDNGNAMIKLGTKSDGSTTRTTGTEVVILDNGRIGVGTNSPQGALDVTSTTAGFVPPRMTTPQRDAIAVGYRPTGTMIFNTQAGKLQVNIGTDAIPVWTNLDTSSSTINTSTVFSKIGTQTINYSSTGTYTPVTFHNILFNNAPAGYITKQANNETVTLGAGKTYKIEVNMGRLLSNTTQHTWCRIEDADSGDILSSVSILPATFEGTNWNSFNTMLAYKEVIGSNKNIQVKCTKTTGGTVIVNDGIAPVWSITIMN